MKKLKFIDSNILDEFKPHRNNIWEWKNFKREFFIFDFTNKYIYCFIDKLIDILKKSNLNSELQEK